jgi:hypothetical protein
MNELGRFIGENPNFSRKKISSSSGHFVILFTYSTITDFSGCTEKCDSKMCNSGKCVLGKMCIRGIGVWGNGPWENGP